MGESGFESKTTGIKTQIINYNVLTPSILVFPPLSAGLAVAADSEISDMVPREITSLVISQNKGR